MAMMIFYIHIYMYIWMIWSRSQVLLWEGYGKFDLLWFAWFDRQACLRMFKFMITARVRKRLEYNTKWNAHNFAVRGSCCAVHITILQDCQPKNTMCARANIYARSARNARNVCLCASCTRTCARVLLLLKTNRHVLQCILRDVMLPMILYRVA